MIDLASSVLPTPVGPAKNITPRGRPRRLDICAPLSPMTERIRMSSALRTACSWPLTRLVSSFSPSAMRARMTCDFHGLLGVPFL